MIAQMGEKTELFDDSGKSRGFYSDQNRVNDLTGKEWLFWTRSVITKPYPPNIGHKLRSLHGGQKPPELCRDIVSVFTKKGESVLDPFMGVGGILLGSALAMRDAVGIDIKQKWIDIYLQVCEEESISACKTICGDSYEVLSGIGGRVFDMVFTDVPYFRMDRSKRSQGVYKKHGEDAREAVQSKLSVFNEIDYADTNAWLSAMERILGLSAGLLKLDGYMAVFIGDMYADNRYFGLSGLLAERLSRIKGLVWKANLIWYDVSKKLHLYGYQYSYIPSMIHQNILVFRKEK
ncbi:MAG: class I SAM-dependent methyltransferase [Spirochaetaceae bacterium]|nr:MAG: class I SAM-dependent methyltransferase [Spirochaetaceae bacterium]